MAGSYRHPSVPGRISEGRLRRSRALLEEGRSQIDGEYLQRVLRDHLDGNDAPPAGATPDDERYYTLCMHSEPVGTTTASLIAPLPADRSAAWPVWVSFGTPCTGIFLPVYLSGDLPVSLSRGGADPESDSAWWAFHDLQEAASEDFATHTPVLRRGWKVLEEKIDIERRGVESSARVAVVTGDEEAAARILTEFMQRTADEVMEVARHLRARLAAS